jgi:hypothetical protein
MFERKRKESERRQKEEITKKSFLRKMPKIQNERRPSNIL